MRIEGGGKGMLIDLLINSSIGGAIGEDLYRIDE